MTETTIPDLAADDTAERDRLLTVLHADGYRDIPEHRNLRPGVRVRHRGHQYPQAYRDGTGTVLAVTEKNPSAWSVSYGMADIEIVVRWDDATGLTVSNVAQYHVEVVEVTP